MNFKSVIGGGSSFKVYGFKNKNPMTSKEHGDFATFITLCSMGRLNDTPENLFASGCGTGS